MSDKTIDVIVVTGPSGAGRSCTLRALEDAGFEAIDNPPIAVLDTIIANRQSGQRLAIGLDSRTRGFSPEAIMRHHAYVLYIDCAQDVLVRRFNETRRRHPLSPQTTVTEGIVKDRALLEPLRQQADEVIDTTSTTPHQLRHYLMQRFTQSTSQNMAVSVISFSYKRNLPISADMVFDCRFLKNPYWDEDIRHLNGSDTIIQEYVASDPLYKDFFNKMLDLCLFLLPAYKQEGKMHISIGLGCTGGQHRSVATALDLQRCLKAHDWNAGVHHRDL